MTKELDRYKLLEGQRRLHGADGRGTVESFQASTTGQSSYPTQAKSESLRCYTCGDMGHLSRYCPRGSHGQSSNPRRCYGCGAEGHLSRSCPKAGSSHTTTTRSDKAETKQPDGSEKQVNGVVNDEREEHTHLRLRIQGTPVDCLLDTGSEITLVPWTLLQGAPMEPCDLRVRAANGSDIPIMGRTRLTGGIGMHFMEIDAYVTKHISGVILGMGWLQRQRARWNFEDGTVELDGRKYRLRARRREIWCRRVVVAEPTVIPAHSEFILSANVLYNDVTHRYEDDRDMWTTEASEAGPGLRVSRTIVPQRSDAVPIRVMNITKKPIAMQAGTVIADLQPVTPCSSDILTQPTSASKENILRDLVENVDEAVGPEYKERLRHLLMEFSETFSSGENDLGRTNVIRHAIDTGEARPVRQPLRRQPPLHQVAIKQHIETMLTQGVIEPAQSPWASNLVMVKKKDGSLRCCIDYRHLNVLTRKDAYPLPRTDACLDAMAGAKWFTTFDLRSSYHQVEMEPKYADKTAFISREGSFRFLTMPFGLCNAGATFQRLMDVIMTGLNFEACLVYLDDIVVFSRDLEQYLQRIRQVLERLRTASLKLKPNKCEIMRRSVEFLGHIVSEGRISPHPNKIAAVVNWPTPVNLRELRAYLGLCSYYRRYVKDFSTVAASLYALTEKGRVFYGRMHARSPMMNLRIV
jgi:hypothetical protein